MYGAYYLMWMLLAFGLQQPALLAGLLAVFLLRKYIPDPRSLWRALSRAGSLKRQVAVNPADITARRDLALLYLDLRRPGAALKVLEAAPERSEEQPELLYLRGLALHRTGKHEEALSPLVRSVELKPTHRYGLPYLAAADALADLGRNEEALDAYERYTDINSSDEEAVVRLARVHMRLGDPESARNALAEARDTWAQTRGARRKGALKRWFTIQWARIAVIHDPTAIAVAVVAVALLAVGGRLVGPTLNKTVRQMMSPDPARTPYDGGYDDGPVVPATYED